MAQTQAAAWLAVPADHPFGLETLPYGSFTTADRPAQPRAGVAIGEHVLDLSAATARLLPGRAHLFSSGRLDAFLAAGDGAWAQVRAALVHWLSRDTYRAALEDLLVPVPEAAHAPAVHGRRLCRLLRVGAPRQQRRPDLPARRRRPADAQLAAPAHRLPRPGRHGRWCPARRCAARAARSGRRARPAPGFGPTARLDFEAELGFVVGVPSPPGEPVPASRFAEHVFGVCLVNDWSARDIQSWEYIPLGPFLSKSFGTTVSPWIVPLAALEHARVRPPSRDTELLPLSDRIRRLGP